MAHKARSSRYTIDAASRRLDRRGNGRLLHPEGSRRPRSACPLTSTLSQLQPVLGQTKPKGAIFGVLEPKWLVGGIPAPACETDQTDQCRAVLPGHLPRYGISHSSGIRTSGNPPNLGVLRTRRIGWAQRGQRGAAGPELSGAFVGMAKTSCFAFSIVAAMSWLANQCRAPRGLQRIRTKRGRACARPLLTPSTQFLETTAPVTG